MTRLNREQLDRTMRAVRELYQLRSAATFPQEMLNVVESTIPSDAGFNEFRKGAITLSVRRRPIPDFALQYLFDLGSRFFKMHPILGNVSRTGFGQALRASDHLTREQWRRSAIYQECFRWIDCDYQVGMVYRVHSRTFGLPLNRAKRDFSDEEFQMFALLRPHIIQAQANVDAFAKLSKAIEDAHRAVLIVSADERLQHATPASLKWLAEYFPETRPGSLPEAVRVWLNQLRRGLPPSPFEKNLPERQLRIHALPPFNPSAALVLQEVRTSSPAQLQRLGLTPREAEVLFWMSEGKRNPEISTILGTSTNTVRRQVERLFSKLRVPNRTAATAMVYKFLRDGSGVEDERSAPTQLSL